MEQEVKYQRGPVKTDKVLRLGLCGKTYILIGVRSVEKVEGSVEAIKVLL